MPDLKTAIKLASSDKAFATEFIKNPEKFKAGFNLTDAQVEGIKKIGRAGILPSSAAETEYIG